MIRAKFSSRFGFVVAAAGSAVGLGNIWKFPFEVGANGGALFLLIYVFFCFVLCYPIMVAEIAIGRNTQKDAVGAFAALGFPRWKIAGLLGVLCVVLILSYYNVIAAWVLGYLFEMFRGNFEVADNFGDYTSDITRVGLLAFLFMATTTFVVSKGVKDGIESAARILMPSLIVAMVVLSIYGLTLPNAAKGIEFYLMPDFSQINTGVVYSALGQAFFSLSLGMGTLLTLGSYLPKDTSITGSSAMITAADLCIAFMAGLLIFPLVFSQGLSPTGGETLIFQALPNVFESLGSVMGSIVGGAFFLLLAFAALTSTVSMLEVPTAYLVDEFSLSRRRSAIIAASVIFIVSIPSLLSAGAADSLTHFIDRDGESSVSFMSFVGVIANDTLLPLSGFLIAVFAAYVWRSKNLNAELQSGDKGVNTFLLHYLNFSLRYVCPVLLLLVLLVTISEVVFGMPLV